MAARELLKSDGRLDCPHCGAIDPLRIQGQCKYCLLEIYAAFQPYRELPHLWSDTTNRYHKSCRPSFRFSPVKPLKRVSAAVVTLARVYWVSLYR